VETAPAELVPNYAYIRISPLYVDQVLDRIARTKDQQKQEENLYLMEYWCEDLVWVCGEDSLEQAEMVDVRTGHNAYNLIRRQKPALVVSDQKLDLGQVCEIGNESIKVFTTGVEWEVTSKDEEYVMRTAIADEKLWQAAKKYLKGNGKHRRTAHGEDS
jgi:hypothetical protein